MTQLINATSARLVRADNNPFVKASDWNGWWSVDSINPGENGVLWPTTQMIGSSIIVQPPMYEPAPKFYGNQTMLRFRGKLFASDGVTLLPLGVVKSFLTASSLFLRQVTADAGGYFELPSEYAGTDHWLDAYKAGSPDVAGTTVNTLQPT